MTSHAGSMPVSILTSDAIVRVAPDADLHHVAATLVAEDVGAVAITGSDGDVHGIVTERDLVHALADKREPAATTAADIAHTTLVRCDVQSTVAAVARELMERYVRHAFVDDGGRIVGVISARDLLGAFVAAESDEVEDEAWA